MSEQELVLRKEVLEKELAEIYATLAHIERMRKPYEAVASGYSGRFSTFWKTEEQARKKVDEYYGKTYFKNGLLYNVQLIKHNENGTQTLLEKRDKMRTIR